MLYKITLNTTKRNQLINVTTKIQVALNKAKIDKGLCIAFVPHTTAGITINEGADPSVRKDLLNKLTELVPESKAYKHLEGNADAHIKSTLVGSSVLIPIEKNKLVLGRWQAVFFCEFDGPRTRNINLKLLKE